MNLLFLGNEDDRQYLPHLKAMVGTAQVFLYLRPITTLAEVELYCKQKNITGVLTTSQVALTKLTQWTNTRKDPSIDNYAGSLFTRNGLEYVILFPLERMLQVNWVPFVQRRFISKLTDPDSWSKYASFNYRLLTPNNLPDFFDVCTRAVFVSADIETFSNPPSIRCIGYTAVLIESGNFVFYTGVLPIDSEYSLTWMRKLNWEIKAPKAFQNGKYDCSYLSMYNAVPYNYLFDTANMFHSQYCELPKDLGFLTTFHVRNSQYWKDMADTQDLEEYYRYCGLDTYGTALVVIEWILNAQSWAVDNYCMEFPLVFPCHLSEMTGIKRDLERLKIANQEYSASIESKTASLRKMLGAPGFNTNSWQHVQKMLAVLGCADIKGTDEKNLKKAGFRHPLNEKLTELVLDIRGDRKLVSTYLGVGTNDKGESLAKEYKGRILYALNPHGTDSGRLASREHHFWCGLQIQNVPRGKSVKQTIVADEGFLLGECDLEQAESRDTAYITGDEKLIAAVSGTRDFHSVNASSFFGRAYEDIYDDSKKKTKDKELRDLSKRVNHGANYNMGPGVLVDTMGLKNIYKAAKILGMPKFWTPKQIAEDLLARFHKTYPNLQGIYYPWVIAQVITHNLLVGATGWTRYCFGRPDKSKSDLNAYVAHPPQSLNAMVLNKAYMRVFYEIAIHREHRHNFKLCAQIHDSILFQFRQGHHYLAEMVRERMEIPVRILGVDGTWREFTVPAAIKAGPEGLGVKYWSDTE